MLIVSSEFPPGPGGIGEHARGLALALGQLGFSVSVLAEWRSGMGEPLSLATVQVEYVHKIGWRKAIDMASQARRWARKNQGGWIIFSGLLPLLLAPVISLGFQGKTLAVLHGHEVLMSRHMKRSWLVWALHRFDVRVAVSEYCRENTRKFISAPIEVIPNGFDPQRFGQRAVGRAQQGPLRLVTVGRVSPRKGQHNVVAALPEVITRFPDVEYHVIGIPDYADRLLAQAAALGVESRVKLHGVLSNEEIAKFLESADVFVMLSETQANGDVEGFGIAILEANYFGLPAIGSRGCGIEQAIRHGYNGWLIDPHSPCEFVYALEEIMIHYSRYHHCAHEWSTGFVWNQVGDRYAELLVEGWRDS